MRRTTLAAAFALCAMVALPRDARADSWVLGNPGDHPAYTFEAEPHALLGFAGPFSRGRAHLGLGFRGTVVLVDNGILPGVNDSVGLTFGGDLFLGGGTIFVPVAMQWNFWLTNHLSLFAEPGVGFALNRGPGPRLLHPLLMVGGRYHFSDTVALTIRVGYPALSIGVSFFP